MTYYVHEHANNIRARAPFSCTFPSHFSKLDSQNYPESSFCGKINSNTLFKKLDSFIAFACLVIFLLDHFLDSEH